MERNRAPVLTITAVPAAIAWPLIFGGEIGTLRIRLFAVGLLLIVFWTALVISRMATWQHSS